MKKKQWFSRLAALLLCVLILAADSIPAAAVTQADIDKVKGEAAQKAEEKKELQIAVPFHITGSLKWCWFPA